MVGGTGGWLQILVGLLATGPECFNPLQCELLISEGKATRGSKENHRKGIIMVLFKD
jgi:hypothetical protein